MTDIEEVKIIDNDVTLNEQARADSAFGMHLTVLTPPVGVPKNFLDQIQIYYYAGVQVNAGSFAVGTAYTILSVGTTDFTLIGSLANTIGTSFTATGAGTGTGNATTNLSRLYWFNALKNTWNYVTATA